MQAACASEASAFGVLKQHPASAIPFATYAGYVGTSFLSAIALGIFIYVAVSYLLMRAHVAPRPWRASAREILRETFWAVLTQPLLPLYYFRGHFMGGEGPGDPIVFVHGYFQNRVNFVGLARAIRAAANAPMFGFNYPWIFRVERNAARLARFVEKVCARTGRPHVTLVAHSLGGLVALEYMHTEEGAQRVRRCVTIASPHAGVRWRGPMLGEVAEQMRFGCNFLRDRAGRTIAVPTLSIFSSHDNLVHPPETSALATRGGKDRLVADVGHLAILFDSTVSREVVGFLREEAS
jgi:pimeloyl-ACP methyl ester carboxylesterase